VSQRSAADELADPGFPQDPYPTFARLRDAEGLRWCAPWGAWVATRYDDVAEALRHDGIDLSAVGQTTTALSHLQPDVRTMLEPIERLFSAGLLWSDPPDHSRIRATVNKALNPRDLERMGPLVVGTVKGAVDSLPLDRPFDVVARFAAPVPVAVLATLLGIPAADVHRVRSWADRLADFMGDPRPTPDLALDAQDAVLEARAAVEALMASGTDGVIGRLAALRAAGAPISDDELHATIIVLLVGGHRTTAAAISSSLHALAAHPAWRAEVVADPSRAADAVDELLRYESPHQRTVRIVRRSMKLGGTALAQGDTLMLMNGAANRDERRFEDPEELEPRRDAQRHLAFSRGIHFCIGAPLARLELAAAIRAFLGRYPDYHVTRPPTWLDNRTLRSLTELWVATGPPSRAW
jgi:cytochrome P450